MKRSAAALYGFLGYLSFLLPVGYLAGFLADVGVPKTVDRGAGPLGPALAVDLTLLLVFGLQHSVMARPAFKRRIERWVPPAMERTTYVVASGLALSLLLWLWRPVPAVLWDVTGTGLEPLAWAGYATGWALAVWATFALSHLHLFGVTQVAAWVRGKEHPRIVLRQTLLYRIVRHPMTAGLLLAFWSTPRMTVGHLVFALGMTVYSLWATVLEERDLIGTFPDSYGPYRRRVPALVPPLRPGLLLPRGCGLGTEISLIAAALALLSLMAFDGLRVPEVSATPTVPFEEESLEVGGQRRTFELFDPGSDGPRPLVLALHGTGGDAGRLRRFLGGELERIATERGWLLAYPEALAGAWNDCRRQGGGSARTRGIDDVAFLRAMISRLVQERAADASRVFVLGYSGGGHMAFRQGLEAPRLVAALAVFGANLPTEEDSICRPRGIPDGVLVVNGTDDLVNPWEGGAVVTPTGVALGRVLSTSGTVATLRRLGGKDARIELLAIPNGGHTVPGRASRFPRAAGRTDRSVQGVETAAGFFERIRSDQAMRKPGR